MTERGGEDPALADELASIRAVGEGRRGDAVNPDDEDVELTAEQTEDIETALTSAGSDN
ncbi:hypothetical protein [Rathayibacter iranicus]|uniref:Uncharacterized protein n=1 Tax=Rathayibacter iranicus NCPPB 2253 = VKM Ac-1602 TaxID=1328868 RepID=A0ABX5LE71_9MICO|nr:hypothetical protein [Rathayibacter iranicus]MWV30149.1 hypothetical protein [Rathayibacter iranicus NCPPB 2253 = VKM Ac-1602]PWJ65336.1 hypothetical protein B0H03_103183 [Rathayibacter iranicus NCPPB 2253 = VKM Ac-1602]